MRYVAVLILLLISTSIGIAQTQTPTIAQLNRMIDVVAAQRNNALNAQAVAEANIIELRSELTKTNDKIKELEDKLSKK